MVAKEFATSRTQSGYPSAFTIWENNYGSGFTPRSVFELEITAIEGSIREKVEWWNKIMDPKIIVKWRQEILDYLTSRDEDDEEFDLEYCGKMVDYAIDECKWLAEQYKKGPARPAAVDGVFVRDDLHDELRERLLSEIASLRSRPAIGSDREDRHPGTPQMVDLVHPSLYCYEQGLTMVLPDVGAEATKMPEWSAFLGKEGRAEVPVSDRFSKDGLQWLPSEFKVSSDGKSCDINSYINCLHPVQDASLYKSISELFCHAVPLLEEALVEAGEQLRERVLRVPIDNRWWEGEPREQGSDEEDSDYGKYLDDWCENEDTYKTFVKPEIPEFSGPPKYTEERAKVNLKNTPLQVIVKIASLELNAGDSYAGGVWHVEGTLDERIVATACCYLACDNISGGELAFRTSVSEPDYEQSDNSGVLRMYGLENGEPLVQEAGVCATSQGRILAWPNTKQHKVCPVKLADTEKPGMRTICCFFLVDPKVRVRSTATVPPQQLAWVIPAVNLVLSAAGMNESALREQVTGHLASPSLLTYAAACERRERLMQERRTPDDSSESFMVRNFSLCEH